MTAASRSTAARACRPAPAGTSGADAGRRAGLRRRGPGAAVQRRRRDPGQRRHPALRARQHPAGAEPDHDDVRRRHPGVVCRGATSTPAGAPRPRWCTRRRGGSMTRSATWRCRRTRRVLARASPRWRRSRRCRRRRAVCAAGHDRRGRGGDPGVGQHQHRGAARGERGQHQVRASKHSGGGDGQHRRAGVGQRGVLGGGRRGAGIGAARSVAPEPAVCHQRADPQGYGDEPAAARRRRRSAAAPAGSRYDSASAVQILGAGALEPGEMRGLTEQERARLSR